MYQNRAVLYNQLEKELESKVLVYITGDRKNMSAQIAPDVIDYFINQLDKIGPCSKISLYLYTRGGSTSAAWNIVNLLRMYCENLQVIIPHKAHSAGTIISLGANEIIMTKQATLSPIDPSINTPLNPIIPGSLLKDTMPVSVEAVKGYMELAKDELNLSDQIPLSNVFLKLTEYVHPLVLGEVYRSRAQIKMLAKRLLINQIHDPNQLDRIIDFLCSESGSHDYTINRREASDDLQLNIKKPTDDQYKIIKSIYDDISQELQLTQGFNYQEITGAYVARRSLLESIIGGSDYFVTEGEVIHSIDPNGNETLQVKTSFEGWRHGNSVSEGSSLSISDGEEEINYGTTDEFQI